MKENPHDSTILREEKNPWYYTALFPLYILAAFFYLLYRFEISLFAIFWYTVPLLIVEIYNIATTIIHLFVTQKISYPVHRPPLKRKTVDAFIPTYNEPEHIVEMTTIGALRIRGIRNVYILDDGNRKNIKKLAERIGAQYVTRNDNSYAKAGNMNNGLKQSDAEFVIFLDCDHVPKPEFIERTLGYFADCNLAFVQTPQVFYNADSIEFRKLPFRNLWNEQTMFYESIQPAKNRFNAAFFCGTGALLRRAALDSVGGFATGTATEDIHTSLKLHAKGWNSLFLPEKLCFGLAPEDLTEYHQQRVRWGAGSLGLLFRTSDSPLIKRGLTWIQRLCYLNSTNAYFYGGVIKLFYIILPVIILFSIPFQPTLGKVFLTQYILIAIPFVFFSNVVMYAYSRKTYHFLYTEQFNIANIFSCLEAIKGIMRVQKKFRVSIKSKMLKENHITYYFVVGLFIILLAADIFGITFSSFVLGKPGTVILNSFIAVSLLWNTYNLFIIGTFIEYLRSYNAREEHHIFLAHTSIQLPEEHLFGTLTRVSLSGGEMVFEFMPKHAVCDVILFTKKGRVMFTVKIESHHKTKKGYTTQFIFENLTVKNRLLMIEYFFDELVETLFQNDFVEKKDTHLMQKLPINSFSEESYSLEHLPVSPEM